MTYFLSILFRWPDGIVLGNLMASVLWVPIAGVGVWLFRDRIGRVWAAWSHKHHTAHLAGLTGDSEQDTGVPGGG